MEVQVISNELFKNSKVPNEAKCELIEEMRKHFTTEDQIFFVNSFYAYLNYHPTEDFIINLSDVYTWIGFARLDPAKRILVNKFSEGNDYQILLHRTVEQVKVNGGAGLNKERIMMNVSTFKSLCMVSGTEKAKEIRKYFLKLENITMSVIKKHLENKKRLSEKQAKSEQIIYKFDKESVVYIGLVEKTDSYSLVKYGKSGNIKNRLTSGHSKTYGKDFLYLYAIKSINRDELERRINNDENLHKYRVKNYNNKGEREMLKLDSEFTLDNFISIIENYEKELIMIQDPELLTGLEKTRHLQEQTKQKQLELKINEEKTKQLNTQERDNTKQLQIEQEKTKQAELLLILGKEKLIQKQKEEQERTIQEKERTIQEQEKTKQLPMEQEKTKQLHIEKEITRQNLFKQSINLQYEKEIQETKRFQIQEQTKIDQDIFSLEKEKTIQEQSKTIQKRLELILLQEQEKTKQIQIEAEKQIELKKLELANALEIRKLELASGVKVKKQPKIEKTEKIKKEKPKSKRQIKQEQEDLFYKTQDIVIKYINSVTCESKSYYDILPGIQLYDMFSKWYLENYNSSIDFETFRKCIYGYYNIDQDKRKIGEVYIQFIKWS